MIMRNKTSDHDHSMLYELSNNDDGKFNVHGPCDDIDGGQAMAES